MNVQPIRILLISKWAVNPYQKLLVAHLQKRGFTIAEEALSGRRLLFDGSPHILHLQNVRPFLTSGGTVHSLARVIHFVTRVLIARATGIKIVWTAHDLESPSKKQQFLDKLTTAMLVRLAHRTIVHSDAARDRLVVAGHVSPRKLRVIPHGNYIGYYADSITRDDARAKLELGEDEVVFLLFGWVKQYKRVVELIRAFRSIPAQNARLVIAGASDRAYEAEVRAEADGDRRILLHLRSIPDAEVQLYMKASDVAVFPYAPVLTSGAIVLAKSFGKACIASRDSGVADAANRDGTFFYDAAADNGLAGALQIAIKQRGRLAEMGAHNRATAAHDDWNAVADATAQLYAEIL